MRADAHAEHRKVHSQHHHSGRDAATLPGERKQHTFRVRTRYCSNTWMKCAESGSLRKNFGPVFVVANGIPKRNSRIRKKVLDLPSVASRIKATGANSAQRSTVSRQLLTSPVASVPPSAGFWTLACLGTTMLLSSLGTSIAIVALPTFVVAFDTSFHAVQWVVLAYLLAVTTLIVSVGQLGDLFGRRRLMMAGIALFTAASVASGASTELWILVAARAVQGLGAAIMMALAMALVGTLFPKSALAVQWAS